MRRIILLLILLLAACQPSVNGEPEQATEPAEPTNTPFPMADGIFLGDAQDFVLLVDDLGEAYAPTDDGIDSPNERVLELRADGAEYIEAAGRLAGWLQQYERSEEAEGPPLLFSVVTMFDSAEGPLVATSREWHTDIWSRIDSGEFEMLPNISGLAESHLVFTDANGTIGVELIYRNLYLYLTGTADEGVDNYDFFADLARNYIARIKAGEP